MKTILLAIVLLLSGSMVSAQITPEALLKKTPSLPKDSCNTVSYTHLDVYKRQRYNCFDLDIATLPVNGNLFQVAVLLFLLVSV